MFNETILKEMEFTRNAVALEAMNIPSISVSEFMGRIVPAISEHFTSFIANFAPSGESIRLSSSQREFLHAISKSRYTDLAPMPAFVPEGMDETYLEFANVMELASERAVGVVDLMNEFSVYLAKLITNLEAKRSSENNVSKYLKLQETRKATYDSIGKCFKNGSNKAEVLYSDVIQRNNDWQHVFNISEKVMRKMNGVDRSKLNKKVTEIGDLLAKVVKSYKSGQLEGTNPEVIRELADGSFQIASELEMFSIVYYRAMGLTTGINLTVENTMKVLSN